MKNRNENQFTYLKVKAFYLEEIRMEAKRSFLISKMLSLVVSSGFVLLFITFLASPIFANSKTIGLTFEGSSGEIKLYENHLYPLDTNDTSINDTVKFGTSFYITAQTDLNRCLCEGGQTLGIQLRLHPANGCSVYIKKHLPSDLDTNWYMADKIPNLIQTPFYQCRSCFDTTKYPGIRIGSDSIYPLSWIISPGVTYNKITQDSSSKTIIYVKVKIAVSSNYNV